MLRAARILVVSETIKEASETADVLRSRGFDVRAAAGDGALAELLASRRPDVVLFDDTGAVANDNVMMLADAVRETQLWRELPFIVLGEDDDGPPSGDAALLVDHLSDSALPAELDHRIRAVARLSVMRAEVRRRAETLRQLELPVSFDVKPPTFVNSPRILIIGAGRGALKIQNAYGANASFIGAPVTNLAIDILETEQVDAAVIDATARPETAQDALETLRRIATWTILPVVVIVDDDARTAAFHEVGAGDVCRLDSCNERLMARLQLLMREYRYARSMQAVFRDDRHIPSCGTNGLATRAFAVAHLMTLVDSCDRQGDAVSLIAVAVDDAAGADKVVNAFASTLTRMVRGEDMGARLDERLFLLLLPGTDEDVARVVRDRIERVLGTTDFGFTEDGMNITAQVRMSLASYRAGDTAESLLARTLEGLD